MPLYIIQAAAQRPVKQQRRKKMTKFKLIQGGNKEKINKKDFQPKGFVGNPNESEGVIQIRINMRNYDRRIRRTSQEQINRAKTQKGRY